jgi:hypothetical protein
MPNTSSRKTTPLCNSTSKTTRERFQDGGLRDNHTPIRSIISQDDRSEDMGEDFQSAQLLKLLMEILILADSESGMSCKLHTIDVLFKNLPEVDETQRSKRIKSR